jgi:methylase of polypeptide subunit release factors
VGELERLEPEVRDAEPRAALVDDGQTERLIREARAALAGWIVLEVHEERADDVAGWLAASGYRRATITSDLAGRARVVEAEWQPTTTSCER